MVIFQAGLISAYIIKTLYFGRYNQMLYCSYFTAFIVAVGLFAIIKQCVLKNVVRDYHHKQKSASMLPQTQPMRRKPFKEGIPEAWS